MRSDFSANHLAPKRDQIGHSHAAEHEYMSYFHEPIIALELLNHSRYGLLYRSTMASVRAILLERRPDLPLCSLRQMRQLRSDRKIIASKLDRKRASREMCEVLTSKNLQKVERDMRTLLEVPIKVGQSCAC